MLRSTFITTAIASLAALALSAPAADARAAKQVTVDASSKVRLYHQGADLYAKADGVRAYRLGAGIAGADAEEVTIHDASVAGRYVAFAVGTDGADFRSDLVVVRDVVRRKFVVQTDPVADEVGFEATGGREVLSLEITREADAAWIVQYAQGEDQLLRRQVVLLERGAGTGRILDAEGATDAARQIDTGSLALNERRSDLTRLFWQRGNGAFSATF